MDRPELDAPRSTKLAIVGLYVLIVLAGSYMASQAWLGAEGVHYLASRRNILNQVFVKRGWLWFTLVYWASFVGRRSALHPATQLRSAVLRYSVATAWWVLFTQWLFGPPLMDRLFTVTGGSCIVEPASTGLATGAVATTASGVVAGIASGDATGAAANAVSNAAAAATALATPIARRVADLALTLPKTSARCRGSGGTWVGGHDPSGHVFLLVHSSLVLWMEILPALLSYRQAGRRLGWEIKLPLALLGLWGFMLFFTAVYFHSFLEKVSGLVFGLVVALVVYVRGETASWGHWFGVGTRRRVPVSQKAARADETLANQ